MQWSYIDDNLNLYSCFLSIKYEINDLFAKKGQHGIKLIKTQSKNYWV